MSTLSSDKVQREEIAFAQYKGTLTYVRQENSTDIGIEFRSTVS